MPSLAYAKSGRVLGDGAVLARLERLGRNPRVFPNLVKAGFPAEQLAEASTWYIRDARSGVERHAGQLLAQGYFDDEPLLALLCRYFGCTDWKLENSPWFFGPGDYERFFHALVGPVEYATAHLESTDAETRWGEFFLRLPFDLGMDEALRSLWGEILHREHYWKPQSDYTHLRAGALFGYVQRSVDIVGFTPDHYHYAWEQTLRAQLYATLARFRQGLEVAVRRWQEQRRDRTERFNYGTYMGGRVVVMDLDVLRALAYFGLDLNTVDEKALRTVFRQRSKDCHPDLGGDPAEFQELSRHKDVIETWLRVHHAM
jgi:hypothetical protein